MPLITLTTDFGQADWFVGSMKATMLSVSSRLRMVDITHSVPPGDVKAGAFALFASCRYFPSNTIHLVVVDPGVGSSRKPIVVKTSNFCFIGPDNGVLSYALAEEEVESIHSIENASLFVQPVSRTFHGRDLFAPVAAHLAKGLPVTGVGPALSSFIQLDWTKPTSCDRKWLGEVVYIDHFGNAITNLPANLIEDSSPAAREVMLANGTRIPIGHYYQQAGANQPIALVGSTEYLEIAINGGNAAKLLDLKVGAPIVAL